MVRGRLFVLATLLGGLLVTAPGTANAADEVQVNIVLPSASEEAYGEVRATNVDGTFGGTFYSYDPAPLMLEPGDYVFTISVYEPGGGSFQANSTPRHITSDTSLTFAPPTRSQAVTLKNHQNANVTAAGTVYCTSGSDVDSEYTKAEVGAAVQITSGVGAFPVTTAPDSDCVLRLTTASELQVQRDFVPSAATLAITLAAPVAVYIRLWPEPFETPYWSAEPNQSQLSLTRGGDRPLDVHLSDGGEGDDGWRPGRTQYSLTVEASGASATVAARLEQMSLHEHRAVEFLDVRSQREVVLDESQGVDLAPDVRPLRVGLEDSAAQPALGTLQARCDAPLPGIGGTARFDYQSDAASSFEVIGMHDPDQPACRLRATTAEQPVARGTADAAQPEGPNTTLLTYPDAHHVTGTLSDGRASGTTTADNVRAELDGVIDDGGLFSERYEGYSPVDDAGQFDLVLADRPVTLIAQGRSDRIDNYSVTTSVIDPVSHPAYDIAADVNPVRVSFRRSEGGPGTGRVSLSCSGDPDGDPVGQTLYTERDDVTGDVTVWGMDGAGTVSPGRSEPCLLFVRSGDTFNSRYVSVPPSGLDVVAYESGDIVFGTGAGDPGDDGVPDIVEALGPNGGDGNGDGEPDHQQAHVTSVPVNGASPGGGTDYLTLVVDEGLTLEEVSTMALSAVPDDPPTGVTLPAGLVSYRISGLTFGQQASVTIHHSSGTSVTGYAKYHDGAWTTLADGLVTVADGAVTVILTDGGAGDDDGSEDGTIVDPGGPAVITSADDDPPDVTIHGVEDGAVSTLGNAPTGVSCTATDASALAGACAVTITGGRSNGVGDFTVHASATDVHGNVGAATVTYSVHYGFSGFLQPINDTTRDPSLALSVFKAGSTVPVKFRLTRADGSPVTPASAPEWFDPVTLGSLTSTVNEPATTLPATTGDEFRFVDGHWQFNWATKKNAGGHRYRIGVQLDDGTVQVVTVGLR